MKRGRSPEGRDADADRVRRRDDGGRRDDGVRDRRDRDDDGAGDGAYANDGGGSGDDGDDRSRRHHRHHRRREQPAVASASVSVDSAGEPINDETGHLDVRAGDVIGDRYTVIRECGKGTFGKVLLCTDALSGEAYAVKVVRRIRRYTEAAAIEADVLADIAAADPRGKSLCVRAYHSFTFRGHFCIVFEPLGMSLYDYVSANGHRALPLHCVQAFADQLTIAVAFLHAMRLVHTDLKLENVLLCDTRPLQLTEKPTRTRQPMRVLAPQSVDIRLIDFGGATYDWEHKSSIINTRQYRSPEVVLGLGWSLPSDVWSLGCILMELYTGELLFRTHENGEHLALMEATLSESFPPSMALANTREARKHFDRRTGRLRFDAATAHRDTLRAVAGASRLEDLVHPRDVVFLDLARGMLRLDPAKRITAGAAVNHRFFTAVRGTDAVPRPLVVPAPGGPRATLRAPPPPGAAGAEAPRRGDDAPAAAPARADRDAAPRAATAAADGARLRAGGGAAGDAFAHRSRDVGAPPPWPRPLRDGGDAAGGEATRGGRRGAAGGAAAAASTGREEEPSPEAERGRPRPPGTVPPRGAAPAAAAAGGGWPLPALRSLLVTAAPTSGGGGGPRAAAVGRRSPSPPRSAPLIDSSLARLTPQKPAVEGYTPYRSSALAPGR